MKIEKSRLVAYANGETRGAETAEIEAALKQDPEAAAYVEQVKAFAKRARADLGAEPLPGGGGPEKILREIARRQSRGRVEDRQAWIQGAVVAAVLLSLVTVFAFKDKLGLTGLQRAGLDHVAGGGGKEPGDEDDPRKGPAGREDPRALGRDFEALGQRATVRESIPHCRFTLPAPVAIDRVPKESLGGEFHRVYLLTESGLELSVSAGVAPQPLIREIGVEERSHEDGFTYFRRVWEAVSVSYYKVPAEVRKPYCWARLTLDGKISEAMKAAAGEPLEAFTRRIAESMDLR